MTPSFRWMFLGVLALANIVVSVPPPLITDACSLICNPGAETEADRLRDHKLFPRSPKASCELQSGDDRDQAQVIMKHCLELCSRDLSIDSLGNCAALLSSFAADLGCWCEALSPLSPNTNRLNEQWRLDVLVAYLSEDIFTTILDSPLDNLILCEIHKELFSKNANTQEGRIYESCRKFENYTDPNVEKDEDVKGDKGIIGEKLPILDQKKPSFSDEDLNKNQKDDIQDNVPAKDDLSNIKETSQKVGLSTEILLTSQQPNIKLKPGDEVIEVKKDNSLKVTTYSHCKIVQVVESNTPEEEMLCKNVIEEIQSKIFSHRLTDIPKN